MIVLEIRSLNAGRNHANYVTLCPSGTNEEIGPSNAKEQVHGDHEARTITSAIVLKQIVLGEYPCVELAPSCTNRNSVFRYIGADF